MLSAHDGREYEQVFSAFVTYGNAADRLLRTVNHDVRAEIRSAVSSRRCPVDGVRIVEPDRQVKQAVRIQKFGAVDAFGYLPVTFAQLGPEVSALRFNSMARNLTRARLTQLRVSP